MAKPDFGPTRSVVHGSFTIENVYPHQQVFKSFAGKEAGIDGSEGPVIGTAPLLLLPGSAGARRMSARPAASRCMGSMRPIRISS